MDAPAAGAAIRQRLDELHWTQQDLSSRSRVSVATIRQVLNGTGTSRPSRRTLAALSAALGWPDDHLVTSDGRPSERLAPPPSTGAPVEFSAMTLAEVAALAARAAAEVDRRLRRS